MKELLIKGALELGVELSEAQVAQFLVYMVELKKWNEKINLTSIDDEREIIIRHFLDSILILGFLHDGERVLDMGSGAGFPGLALKVANPTLDVICMDKVEKKVRFLRHIIRTLGLSGVRALSARADGKEPLSELGSSFDVVVSRAFSGIKVFLRLSLPYIKPGGRIVAIKGPKSAELMEEISEVMESAEFGALSLKGAEETRIPLSDRVSTVITFVSPA